MPRKGVMPSHLRRHAFKPKPGPKKRAMPRWLGKKIGRKCPK